MKKSTRNIIIVLIILAIAVAAYLIIQNKKVNLSPSSPSCKCDCLDNNGKQVPGVWDVDLGSNKKCSDLNGNGCLYGSQNAAAKGGKLANCR